MTFSFYLLAIVAAFGTTGIGRLTLRGSPLGRQFVAGLVIISSLCAGLTWLAPVAVVPVIRILIVVGSVANLWAARTWIRTGIPRPDRRTLGALAAATAIGIAGTFQYHFRFADLGEGIYIFGPAVELFLADYLGPLRIPVYFPWETSAFHVPATISVAILAAFENPATMIHFEEARFLLAAFATARFAYGFIRASKLPWPFAAVLVLAGMIVFHAEFDVSFAVSTFLFMVLAVELVLILLVDDQSKDRTVRDALFFLIGMVGAKASIFYIPALVALWVVLRFPRLLFHPALVACGTLNLAQLALTALRPMAFEDVSIKLSLVNLGGGRPGFDYFPALAQILFAPSEWTHWLPSAYSVGTVLIFLTVVLKYWLLPVKAVGKAWGERREFSRIVEVYLLTALIGLILIRHDQHGITHQIWAVFGTAPLALGAILVGVVTPDSKRLWKWALLGAAAVWIAVGDAPWYRMRSPTAPHFGAVTYEELMRMTDKEALTPRAGEPVTAVCERALYKGLRIKAGSVPKACLGALGALALEPR